MVDPTDPDSPLHFGFASSPDCRYKPPIEIGPGQFQCELCFGIFDLGDDDEAKAEAVANGFDPASCGMICDDCYANTPWGDAQLAYLRRVLELLRSTRP